MQAVDYSILAMPTTYTFREELDRESARISASVLYHSRMMYLASPTDTNGSPVTKDQLSHTGSAHTQAIHGLPVSGHRRVPVQGEKLVPPVELMTRPQALR